MTAPYDWSDLSRKIAELCVRVPVSAGVGVIAKEIATLAPDLAFREVLARGGWYRLGGVVDAGGSHVTNDLEKWAEDELASHDDDMGAFCDDYLGQGLKATRLAGRTHYLVAPTGPHATDFVQLEIEELQEVVCHSLFDGDVLPLDLDELVDPPSAGTGCQTPQPIGIPFLTLRRLTPVSDFLGRMRAQKPEPQSIHRFLEAWEKSSAGNTTQFSNHWVLAVREHLDRYKQTILQATPVAALIGAAPKFSAGFGIQGVALHDALVRYDKAAGYPMAWFFHMLTLKSVPHALASAVIDDVQSGFHYLPDRDASIVKDWLHHPYGF